MESDSLLKESTENYLSKRATLILFGILLVLILANTIVLVSSLSGVFSLTISSNMIQDRAVTNSKLNSNVVGRGLTQLSDGTLEIDPNLLPTQHRFSEQVVLAQPYLNLWDVKTIVGANGFPLILSMQEKYPILIICSDIICSNTSQKNLDLSLLITSGDIIIGTDGFPLISFYSTDLKNQISDLQLVHCQSADCSESTLTTVDKGPNVGWYNQLHIGPKGFPIITYLDNVRLNLKILYCQNIQCGVFDIITVVVPGGILNLDSKIGIDGNLLFIYVQNSTNVIHSLHCNDYYCGNVSIFSFNSWKSVPLEDLQIQISGDGMAIISASKQIGHCEDVLCSSVAMTNFNTSQTAKVSVDSLGFPFLLDQGFQLTGYRCLDFGCSKYASTVISPQITMGSSVAFGIDGLAFISQIVFNQKDGLSQILMAIHCGNALCTRWRNSQDIANFYKGKDESKEKVIGIHDYTAQHEDELTFKALDIINLLGEEQGWGKGELNGEIGLFPMNFVRYLRDHELTEENLEDQPLSQSLKHTLPFFGKAKFDYDAVYEDELSFRKGDLFRITEFGKDGWYVGAELSGEVSGLLPGNYIIPIDSETGEYLLQERFSPNTGAFLRNIRNREEKRIKKKSDKKSKVSFSENIPQKEDKAAIKVQSLREIRKNKKIIPPATRVKKGRPKFLGTQKNQGTEEENQTDEKIVVKEPTIERKIELPDPRETRQISLESQPLVSNKQTKSTCCTII